MSLQEEVRTTYQSSAALRCPPHITLHMPFKLGSRKLESLMDHLSKVCSDQEEFPLELEGFSAFAPRVIYIHVPLSEALKRLQREVQVAMRRWNLSAATHGDRGFVPHVTIAFRDLRRARFDQAWSQYQNREFTANCTVKEVCLLRHDGKRWQIHQCFPLSPVPKL